MEPHEPMRHEMGARPALFSERLVALVADALMFYGLFLLTLKLTDPHTHVFLNPRGEFWLALWGAAFMLYQAGSLAAGRPTVGKALMGLEVVGLEGAPLPFPRALARSLAYLLSSFFNLGFLWALVHPEGRTWHDLIAGSKVMAVRPRPAPVTLLASTATLGLLVGAFFWQAFGASRFYRIETLAYSQNSLRSLGRLEEAYRKTHGKYTENVDKLVGLTPDPEEYYVALATTFQPDKGILIQVQPGGRAWVMTAYAKDLKGTRLSLAGPDKS